MARIVFEVEVEGEPGAIVAALDSAKGVASWWTDDVDFDGGRGSTMRLGFPIAPKPFELRVDEVSDERVVWSSVGDFPPHWKGTTITWTLDRSGDRTTVHFEHDGWANDEGPFPSSAYTWGQLLRLLRSFVETGAASPLFVDK